MKLQMKQTQALKKKKLSPSTKFLFSQKINQVQGKITSFRKELNR